MADPRRFALTLLTSYLGQGLSRDYLWNYGKRGCVMRCRLARAGGEIREDGMCTGNIDKLEGALERILGELKGRKR